MIDRARWQQASAALDALLALAPAERGPWLDALRARDAPLAAQVERMLARMPPLDGPAFEAALAQALQPNEALPPDEPAAPQPGQRLGPWALLRCIGSGGMGQVWLAERADGLYQAQAAIKLLRSDLPRARLAERFARERAVLARLNHPAIAKLLDAGIGADGQAYLVLEHVDGQLLGAHVRAHCPTVADRVRLMVRIAQAVEHAHAQLIVHRDLKPGNVMVTPDGMPKLLDFGIAGLLDGGADTDADAGALTRLTGRGLTLGYAAPEQITGEPIGVAADVFSLGVLLFELLSGQLPFGPAGASRTALEHAVLHAEPQRLSAVRGEPPAAPVDAQRARGDLEAVVAKSLRKRPGERQASVRAFIDDLENWLQHRPVAARRDDWRHRVRLWLRRNALLAGLGSAALLALGTGLGISLWQWQRAEAAARQSDQLTGYLTQLLASASPDAHGGQWPSVLQLLETSRRGADSAFASEPDTRWRLLDVLGHTYRELNRPDLAIPLVEQALALARQRYGDDDGRTVQAQLLLGRLYVPHGPWDQVVRLLEPLQARARARFGETSEPVRQLLFSLSHAYLRLGRLAEAEALLREVTRITEAVVPADDFERTAPLKQWAVLYADTGRVSAALAELRKTQRFWANPAPAHRREALVLRRNTLAMLNRLGVDEGNARLAEQLFAEMNQLMGPRNAMAASLHAEMARWHTERAEYAQALRHREAVLVGSAPDSSTFRTQQVSDRALRLVARSLAQAAAPDALRAEAQAIVRDLLAAEGTLGNVRVETWLALARAGLVLGDTALTGQAVQRLRAIGGPQLSDGLSQGSRLSQFEGELARAQGDLVRSRQLIERRVAQLASSPDLAVPPHWAALIDLAYTLTLQRDPGAAALLERAERLRPPGMPRPHPLDAVSAWLRAVQAADGKVSAPAAQAARHAVEAAFGRAPGQPLPTALGGVFN